MTGSDLVRVRRKNFEGTGSNWIEVNSPKPLTWISILVHCFPSTDNSTSNSLEQVCMGGGAYCRKPRPDSLGFKLKLGESFDFGDFYHMPHARLLAGACRQAFKCERTHGRCSTHFRISTEWLAVAFKTLPASSGLGIEAHKLSKLYILDWRPVAFRILVTSSTLTGDDPFSKLNHMKEVTKAIHSSSLDFIGAIMIPFQKPSPTARRTSRSRYSIT